MIGRRYQPPAGRALQRIKRRVKPHTP
jgi:hypothetical protein